MMVSWLLSKLGYVKVPKELVDAAVGTSKFLVYSTHYYHGTENYRRVAAEHKTDQDLLIKALKVKL
jgi:intergrase/recombinase